VLYQQLAGRERDHGAALLEPLEIVLVHSASIAPGAGNSPVTKLEAAGSAG
jgi:hypothetical protein